MGTGQAVGRTPRAFQHRGNVVRADRIPRWASQLFAPDLPELDGSVVEVIEVEEDPVDTGRHVAELGSRGALEDVKPHVPLSPSHQTFVPTAGTIARPTKVWD